MTDFLKLILADQATQLLYFLFSVIDICSLSNHHLDSFQTVIPSSNIKSVNHFEITTERNHDAFSEFKASIVTDILICRER